MTDRPTDGPTKTLLLESQNTPLRMKSTKFWHISMVEFIPSLLSQHFANSLRCPAKYLRKFFQNWHHKVDWKIEPLENLHTWKNKILGKHKREAENWTSRKWKKIITSVLINILRWFFLLCVYRPTTYVWDTRVQFSLRYSCVPWRRVARRHRGSLDFSEWPIFHSIINIYPT